MRCTIWSKYLRRPGGYIETHRLQGHAFLIRRDVFEEVGGFDAAFGRGYYEDVDLGRRLDHAAVGDLASILKQAFNTREGGRSDADAPSESWCAATAIFTFSRYSERGP